MNGRILGPEDLDQQTLFGVITVLMERIERMEQQVLDLSGLLLTQLDVLPEPSSGLEPVYTRMTAYMQRVIDAADEADRDITFLMARE
jgi:hypothetical protein